MKLLTPEDYNNYLKVCEMAINDEKIFNNFKRIRQYVDVLEHVSYKLGIEYLDVLFGRLKKYVPHLDWKSIMINDTIGNPRKNDFEQFMKKYVKLPHYIFSPTTIRYIVTGLDILEYVENSKKKTLNIVEIGGGYGGQCKILYDMAKMFDITIESYGICDLTAAGKLQQKFLSNFKYINGKFIKYDDVCNNIINFDNIDLVISNYCLGEIAVDIQNTYIDTIVSKSKMAYFVWNSKDINKKLKDYTKCIEIPQTGTCNKILTKNIN